ncbi:MULTISPECIES: ATP-binding protein [unclassified Mammaliicoccus]|uniref:ATP-binding protein n=1 Tax=Mammaliicoccus TaxID=2803850 RepID=UPI001EFB81AF|nr:MULTISPECIES: ATP-binding protein [unclassified Mammaliicoccus]
MTKTTEINFLQPGISQIRKSIKGIDDSYNNEWDILAELLQNSVDAIRLKYDENKEGDYKGKIDIYINSAKNVISIKDNGIGIDYKELPYLLRPFSSGKEIEPKTVGEKGVGLTFALFSSNLFEIKTGNKKGCCRAEVKDALNWKEGIDDKDLTMEISEIDEKINGTIITLSFMKDLEIFDLNNEQMKYLIRTKTAIGNTAKIWKDDIDIEVNYEFVDNQNMYNNEVLPFEYFNIIDKLSTHDKISLVEFFEYSKDAMRSDRDKRTVLKDKVVYKKDTLRHSGNRLIHYIAYFIPNRNAWEKLNISYGLLPKDMDEGSLNNHLEKYYYARLDSGIYTAVKGMPTGIGLNHPSTGNAGYWPNMFILFQDDKLAFDIGRKSIHGQQQNILKKYAKDIFNEFTKVMSRYGARSFNAEERNWDRDNIFESVNSMRMLDKNLKRNTAFEKIPNKQEAQVSAMFYEQIGRGNIKGLDLYTTGYKGKYDLYARIQGKGNVVIEFKSELRNIRKDFSDEQKLFDEIDCIVCWDVTEADKDKFHELGISITELKSSSMFSSEPEIFPNATHKLELSGFTKPIYVIDMKIVLNKLS